MVTGHTIVNLEDTTLAIPMLLIGLALLVSILLLKLIPKSLEKWGFSVSCERLEFSEELPDYCSVVSLQQSRLMRHEYNYYEKKYGFKIAPDFTCD